MYKESDHAAVVSSSSSNNTNEVDDFEPLLQNLKMITQLAAAFAALSLWPGAYAMRPVFVSSNNTADGNATTDPMAACKLYAHMNVHLSSGWEPLAS
jgi:hypothetical protein